MKKFAFYVSNRGTRLKNFLIKYRNNYLLKQIEFILIDSLGNQELKNLCQDHGIIYYENDLVNQEDKNLVISNIFLKYLNNHNVEFAFIFADKILVGELLLQYKNKLINFHPSLLPSHKGLYAIDEALKQGTFLLGNSAHIITEKLDEGSVIMQNIFPRVDFNTYDDVLDNQLIMLLQLMIWIDENRFLVNEDGNVIIKNARYKVQNFIPNIEI